MVQTKEDCPFGMLNNKVFRCLTKLASFRDLEYTALMAWSNWQERILPAGKNPNRRCIGLDINISGPRCELDDIARGLSQAELFLQLPHHGTSNLPYENPQYLQLPGLVQVVELPAFPSLQMPNVGTHVGPADNQSLPWNDGYPDFDKLLEELPRHEYLKESVVDIRVTTPLLKYSFLESNSIRVANIVSHQKIAVDWVIRRETSNTPISRSLWEIESSSNDLQ